MPGLNLMTMVHHLSRILSGSRRSRFGIGARAWLLRNADSKVALAIGFSRWKEKFAGNILKGDAVLFIDSVAAFDAAIAALKHKHPRCIIWSFKDEEIGIGAHRLAGLKVERVEDGFIRSFGRGIDQSDPWSLCIDPIGMYFDASRPSLFEAICNNVDHYEFRALRPEAERALALLLASNVTKYNRAGGISGFEVPQYKARSVLVLGQVEDDRSITRNENVISTNEELLRQAIKDYPGCRILFKQHPDCVGTRRRSGFIQLPLSDQPEDVVEVDVSCPLPYVLRSVDVVYTISSLGGFEGLLRGKRVVTFGSPFYAGWGLTEDHVRFPRRNKKLSLLELFYVAYVQYPIYMDPATGDRKTIFDVIEKLRARA